MNLINYVEDSFLNFISCYFRCFIEKVWFGVIIEFELVKRVCYGRRVVNVVFGW